MNFQINEKCEDCPTLREMSREIDMIKQRQDHMVDAAMSLPDAVRTALTEQGDLPNDVVDSVLAQKNDQFTEFTKNTGRFVEIGDTLRDVTVREAELFQKACLGQLRMRATTRLGRTVTVTVCASQLAPLGSQYEASHVKRAET